MKFMKAIFFGFLGSFVLVNSFQNLTFAEDEKRWFGDNLYVEHIWVPWTEKPQGSHLLDSIRSFINWALWLLATVALVICLYAGFQMMTAGWDSGKYEKWFDLIKKAWIGLVIIGLSWMIVSFVMWIIEHVTADS